LNIKYKFNIINVVITIKNNIYKDKIILIIKMTENKEVGQVQWFDHKKGFGYIDSIKPGTEHYGKEVFFHYSEIKCDNSFKKLMPGEIVTFFVGKKSEEDPRNVCKNIRPIYDAKCLVDNVKYIYRVREKNKNGRDNDDVEHGDGRHVNNESNNNVSDNVNESDTINESDNVDDDAANVD